MKIFSKLITKLSARGNHVAFASAMDGDNAIVLGQFAETALKNPAIETAFKKAEADLVRAWETSPPKDAEAREHLYYTIQGLALVRLKLQGMVNNMLYEKKTAEAKAKKSNGGA